MIFSLEALQAKHGDALLLHYGPDDDRQLIVIDGGPAGVFRRVLEPRLEALRGDRDQLPIRMLMISHIDDDHIRGVLDLMRRLRQDDEDGVPLRYRFATVWHNSFDDIVGDHAEEMQQAATAEAGGADRLLEPASTTPLSHGGGVLLASVPQGRVLRSDVEALGIVSNAIGPTFGKLIAAEDGEPVSIGSGLSFRILGPLRHRVDELQTAWDKELERRGLAVEPDRDARTAAYVDESVYNLASLVVLAELDGKTMLLTGDARGDDILAGLRQAGLLDDADQRDDTRQPAFEVDILKMPHHGSDRNLETDFFRQVHARHYIISGDGRHGNPEPAAFQMLFAARGAGSSPYTIHLTYGLDQLRDRYPLDHLQAVLAQARDLGVPFELRAPQAGEPSLTVSLLD